MMAEGVDATATIAVDEEFFREVLPQVQDLGELKVTLHVIYRAALRGSSAVPLADLLDPTILRSLGPLSPEPAEQRLRHSLDRAVVNGALLRLTVGGHASESYFLPATARNRELVARLRHDDIASDQIGLPPTDDITIYRPNVFAFYEQHIGPLTPLIAEQLRDAERSYPRAWIEEAILTAVEYNRRSWRYVEAILTRWDETGGPRSFSDRS